MRRWAMLLALAGLDLAVLTFDRPRFRELGARLGAPHAWLRADGTDQALATLAGAALWLAALWLALGLVALASTRLPGAAGRFGQLASRRLLPGAVRRLLAGSAGIGILVAPVASEVGAAATAASTAHRAPASVTTALPSPGWPLDPPARPRLPAPQWPTAPQLPAPQPPTTPVPDGGSPPHRDAPPEQVRVQPGDSLWLLAARRLDAPVTPQRVAHAWPRWYAANRAVIGPDPGLLHPGELLHDPDATR